MERFDVVVVGGRCAGAAMARLLAEAGARVLVVDRATFPSDTVSTHSIAWHGTELLARWGLLDAVRATGAPTASTMGVRLGAFDVERLPGDEGSPGLLAPRRTVLDDLLLQAARAAGAQVWEATTVRDVTTAHGRVTGIGCVTPTGPVEVHADLVVGADGARSFVARQVAAPVYDRRPSQTSGMYAYWADVAVDQPELAFTDHQGALAFPTNDGLTCIAAIVHDSRFSALSRGGNAAFAGLMETVSARLTTAMRDASRRTRFVAFRGTPAFFRVPHGDGWLLVGDAGHYKDPFTGQGIADAFLSAQLASDAVLGHSTFDEFHERRDALAADMHAITAELSRLEWTDDDAVELFLRFRARVAATAAAVRDLSCARLAVGR